ncbi:unnamed protein product, partial [Strongylus vulgaris]
MHFTKVILILSILAVISECIPVFNYVNDPNIPVQRTKRWYYPGGGFFPLGGGGGFPGAGGFGGTLPDVDLPEYNGQNVDTIQEAASFRLVGGFPDAGGFVELFGMTRSRSRIASILV